MARGRGAHLAFFARRPPNRRQGIVLRGGVRFSETEVVAPNHGLNHRKCPVCGHWVKMDVPRYHEHPQVYDAPVRDEEEGQEPPVGQEPKWVCTTDGCVLRLEQWNEPGACQVCGGERRPLEAV